MLIRFVLRISTTQIAKKSDCPVKYRTSGNPINGMAQGRGDKFEDTLYKILADMEGNNNIQCTVQYCGFLGTAVLRETKGQKCASQASFCLYLYFPRASLWIIYHHSPNKSSEIGSQRAANLLATKPGMLTGQIIYY